MRDRIFSRIIPLHSEVAERVKQFENALVDTPPEEVLNELRYVLRAVVEIEELLLEASPSEEKINHAEERAYHALLCTYHDLVDGLAIDFAIRLDFLSKNYLEALVEVLGPKRLEMLNLLETVNDAIANTRGRLKERNEIYEKEIYEKWFNDLLNSHSFLTRTVTSEVVRVNKELKKKKWLRRFHLLLSYSLGILGIAAAFYFGLK